MSQGNTKAKSKPLTLVILGLQHVIAMFGATVLVPALTGLNPSVSLFAAGIGTWIFHLVTKRKVPVFLGSSFAFIAAIQVAAISAANDPTLNEAIAAGGMGPSILQMAQYQAGLPYALGGIVVAGALYLVLALLVKLFGAERVRSFFPPVVVGPMIIIIGLMLAGTAISSITAPIEGFSLGFNWLVAALTVAIIVIVSVFARGFIKVLPILIGIIGGYAIACALGMVNFAPVNDARWFAVPQFMWPKFSMQSILIVAPIAIVTFVEHIGDITASSAVTGNDFVRDPGLHRTLIGDGIATSFAGLIGGPANTTYSENTGVLAATKNYNPVTLEIAATCAVAIAFIGKLGAVLQTLPGPVMGGVSVVLFGMIAAVGLRTLVENQVDFTNTRNLLIVGIMLVLALGNATINIDFSVNGAPVNIPVNGVALSAVLGIIMNKLLPERVGQKS